MAHLIKVTQSGGLIGAPTTDTEITINADLIRDLEDVISGVGTTKITMTDDRTYYVNETRDEITEITNK